MTAENVVYGMVLFGLFGFAMKWAFTANTSGFDKRLNDLLESDAKPVAHAAPASELHRKRLFKQTVANTADSRSIYYRMNNSTRR